MNADLRPFELALADPLETARGPVERREGWLVRVTDDEAAGVGEAAPLAGWTEPREACERALREAVDALHTGTNPNDVLADLDGTPAARHAVELAVADLRATREGIPLYRWLGAADRTESVPVNATIGDAPVAETVEAAERAVSEGFDCLKLKAGARPLPADIERVEAVAEAVDADLRVDANGAWSRAGAQQFLDAAPDRLEYVEQPLPATDLAGLAALAGPVALDETLAAVDFADALDAVPDAVVLKPMALGGPRRAVELAERAREAGVEPVVTTTIDGAVARAAAVHVAAAIPEVRPCGLATGDRLATDLLADVASVSEGRVAVPQADGNGTREAW